MPPEIPDGLAGALLGAMLSGNAKVQSLNKRDGDFPKVFSYAGTQWVLILQLDSGWICANRAQMDQPYFGINFIPLDLLSNEYPEGEIPVTGYAMSERVDKLMIAAVKLDNPDTRIAENNGQYPYPNVHNKHTLEKYEEGVRIVAEQIREKQARMNSETEDEDEDD